MKYKVYGVIRTINNKSEGIVKDRTAFYFKKSFAVGVAQEWNRHISAKNKKEKYIVKPFNLEEK